jgi:hypothetical protein
MIDDVDVDVCGQMPHFASESNVRLSLHCAVSLFAWVMMVQYVVGMGMVTCLVEIWRFEIADNSADGAAIVCTCYMCRCGAVQAQQHSAWFTATCLTSFLLTRD